MHFRSFTSFALVALGCAGISNGQTILGCADKGGSVAPKFVLAWNAGPVRLEAFDPHDPALEPLRPIGRYRPEQNRFDGRGITSHLPSTSDLEGVWASWHRRITTTVFWVGESTATAGPVDNRCSAWDHHWVENFGGADDPNPVRGLSFARLISSRSSIPFIVLCRTTTFKTVKPKLRRPLWFPGFGNDFNSRESPFSGESGSQFEKRIL